MHITLLFVTDCGLESSVSVVIVIALLWLVIMVLLNGYEFDLLV